MTFHHVGIPSVQKRQGETFLESVRLSVTDPAANPYRIEWVRFETDSPMPQAVQSGPHLAFMVDDLAQAMAGKTVLVKPFEAMPGLHVAFVEDDGAVVEFMQQTA